MRKPYPSDLTDEQWEILRPLIPVSRVGRPRQVDMREVLNAIFYLNRAGCQWDMLPHDLPARSTVHDHFAQWKNDGTWQRITDALRQQVRVAAGKEPTPSAGSIDSQTVKTTEIGGVRGDDGGQKITGRKRHLVVETLGLLLAVVVTAASADDGTTAPAVLGQLDRQRLPRLGLLWADQKYHTHALNAWRARTRAPDRIEIVARPAGSKGFVLLHRRWVVERTHAWFNRYRRNSKDSEWSPESSASMIRVSAIHNMLRKLSPGRKAAPFNYPKKNREIIPG